jgi:hypothetical protein
MPLEAGGLPLSAHPVHLAQVASPEPNPKVLQVQQDKRFALPLFRRKINHQASNIGRKEMPDYRAYIMGPDGHVQNRVELRCDDDAETIRLAEQLVDGRDIELWQLDRHIETLRHTAEWPSTLRQSITADRAR